MPGAPWAKLEKSRRTAPQGYRLQLRAETLDRVNPETLLGGLRTR